MINRETTFVLGAGASMDYGYPSGAGLKKQILSLIEHRTESFVGPLKFLGVQEDLMMQFYLALLRSGRPSVDAFLEHRKDYLEIGKLAMALVLAKYENLNGLFTAEPNWYEHLYIRMNTSFDQIADNRVSFVTFNYDRSLEAYLFEAIKNSYDKTDEEVATVLSQIPIYHVHGKLGDLPWESDEGLDYKRSFEPDRIARMAAGIRVISEVTDEAAAFEGAIAELRESARIIFLGFGFHDANIQRLNLPVEEGQSQFLASAYGMTPLEKRRIEGHFKPSRIQLGEQDWDALYFLREKVYL